MTNRHKHFTGATSYAEWLTTARRTNGPVRTFDGLYPSSPLSVAGMRMLREGDETNLDKASALVNRLTLQIETPSTEWYRDVQGYFPAVDAYIMGQPQCMWMEHPIHEEHSPIKLFVGITSSASITQKQITERGCAIAAFVLAMANVRPVTIVPYVCLGGGSYGYRTRRSSSSDSSSSLRNMLISWQISSTPLILSELMAVTRPEITRYIGIESCRQLFGRIAEDDSSFHQDAFSEDKMREHLGAAPDDLYLPSIYASDPLLNDPVGWIQKLIDKFTSGEEATLLTETPTDY